MNTVKKQESFLRYAHMHTYKNIMQTPQIQLHHTKQRHTSRLLYQDAICLYFRKKKNHKYNYIIQSNVTLGGFCTRTRYVCILDSLYDFWKIKEMSYKEAFVPKIIQRVSNTKISPLSFWKQTKTPPVNDQETLKKHSRNTFFLLKKQNSVHHSETFKDKILPIMKKNSNQSHLPRQRHIAFCMAIVSNKALSLSLSLSLCPSRNKKKCPKPYATKHNKIIPKNMTTTNASYKTNVVQRVDDTSHGNVK